MITVVWLLTSPRLPAGLLTAEAWDALRSAPRVAAAAETPTVEAVRRAGVDVAIAPDAAPLLETGGVWIVGDDGDEALQDALAERLAGHELALEVLYGSWDPRGARLLDLVEAVDRLHADDGCPWHKSQTHATLGNYLLEETYETLDAIASGDPAELREELGDLLFQPILHARLASASPEGAFDIDDVAAGIVDKIIRRHPHVWGDADPDDLYRHWNEAKAAEKSHRAHPGEGVSRQLPALAFATKLIERFADAGTPLDLPDPPAGLSLDPGDPGSERAVGEFLLGAAAAARAAGVDPELALRHVVAERAGLDANSGGADVPVADPGADLDDDPDDEH